MDTMYTLAPSAPIGCAVIIDENGVLCGAYYATETGIYRVSRDGTERVLVHRFETT